MGLKDMMRKTKATININTVITGIIGIILLFLLLAELMPEAMTAGDTLNASGIPLGNLFVGGGVIFVIIMAGFLLKAVKMAK